MEKESTEKKGQIMLLASWREVFDTMPNEQIGQIIKAMYAYQFDGKEPEQMTAELFYFWVVVRNWLDDNSSHYQEVCRKRQEAINNRWKKQKEKEKLAAMKPEERLAHELIKKVKFDGGSVADHISSSNLQFYQSACKIILPFAAAVLMKRRLKNVLAILPNRAKTTERLLMIVIMTAICLIMKSW